MTESIRTYVRAVYGFDAVVQRMREDDWNQPSPCDAWDARAVVVHNAWAFDMFVGMVRGRPAAVPPTPDATGVAAPSDDGYVIHPEVIARSTQLADDYAVEPLTSWNRDRDALLEALDEPGAGRVVTRSPWGETDIDSWLSFGIWDPLVHTWDLAEAVGQPTVVDMALCELALERARAFDATKNLRRPGVATSERESVGPDQLSRLLAFAGRDLNWRSPT